MKKTVFPVVLIALVLALSFIACDNFFSKSWGSFRDYDPDNIDVTADNIDDWVKRSVGNPALARAVNIVIDRLLKSDDFVLTPETAKLVSGRVKLLVESVGMGTSLLSNAGSALGDLANGDVEFDVKIFSDMFKGMQEDFKEADGKDKAKELADLLVTPAFITTEDGLPKFNDVYGDNVSSSEVVDVILVLVMAEAETSKFDFDDFDSIAGIFDDENGLKFTTETSAGGEENVSVSVQGEHSDTQMLLAAYCNLLIEKEKKGEANDPVSSALVSLIKGQ